LAAANAIALGSAGGTYLAAFFCAMAFAQIALAFPLKPDDAALDAVVPRAAVSSVKSATAFAIRVDMSTLPREPGVATILPATVAHDEGCHCRPERQVATVFCNDRAMSSPERDSLPERDAPAGMPAPIAPSRVGLRGVVAGMGNRGFASAVLARRPAAMATLARDPDADEGPPPIAPEVTALAETKIAPELLAVSAELLATPSPVVEQLRPLKARVATVRGLFDTMQPAGDVAATNWGTAMVNTVLARTLLDGMIFPESDASLRLAWGKTLGTCRQLVGLLRAAEADAPPPAPEFAPAPSPNPLPPPLPPPIGSEPAVPTPAAKPAVVMESEICPRLEQAIGEIAYMVTSATKEELEAVLDRYGDIPDKIYEVANGQEFGPIAALEFMKGLELVNQATLEKPEQLADIAGKLQTAAHRVTNLNLPPGEDDPEPPPAPAQPAPAFTPAPSINPLPPPPPPPLRAGP
jgi:hypothetical protein